MEISIDLSDADSNEEEVIVIDSAGSDNECMETADDIRLPPTKGEIPETDEKEVTSMLKLPKANNREEAVDTIRRMMPSSPYHMENLERRMLALHTGSRARLEPLNRKGRRLKVKVMKLI